ncbi:MAG: amidohydrolase, partial [Phaeodactylibacter sp.]|nr:amidohydrolase [Phaeodactylibacter sp.]
MIQAQIKTLAESIFPEVIDIRRHLHQHPELSFQETQTGRYIAQKLQEFGIEYQHGIAENGVVGLIKGKDPDRAVVALRADFDALPIEEANEVPYKSQNPGVMHACG